MSRFASGSLFYQVGQADRIMVSRPPNGGFFLRSVFRPPGLPCAGITPPKEWHDGLTGRGITPSGNEGYG
jgi:hypothetical protein